MHFAQLFCKLVIIVDHSKMAVNWLNRSCRAKQSLLYRSIYIYLCWLCTPFWVAQSSPIQLDLTDLGLYRPLYVCIWIKIKRYAIKHITCNFILVSTSRLDNRYATALWLVYIAAFFSMSGAASRYEILFSRVVDRLHQPCCVNCAISLFWTCIEYRCSS